MGEDQISVIVPIYNAEKYLDKCIRSVLKQTYQNIELVLVDDGSADHSLAVCNHYQQTDSRVRVFHQANRGVSAARNYGLELARSGLVTFIDSDDYVLPNYLEELHTVLTATNSQIAISDFQYYDDHGNLLVHLPKHQVTHRTFTPQTWFNFAYGNKDDYLRLVFTVLWGNLYKKEVLQEVWCPENSKVDDEFTTWKTYLQADKIVYLNDEDYIYRINRQGLSHGDDRSAIQPLNSLEEQITFLRVLGFDTQILEQVYVKRLKKYRKNCLMQGDYRSYQDADFKLKMIAKYC